MVHELIQQVGIDGCGGKSGGLDALCLAADKQQLDTMATLTNAGVVDTGPALSGSAEYGRESSVKFLLQQQGGRAASKDAYLNYRDSFGGTPLIHCIDSCGRGTPRIARMLVDAGADTASVVRVTNNAGVAKFAGTPLAFAIRSLRGKSVRGQAATEEQVNGLKGVCRLLARLDAVRAISWLWPNDAPVVDRTAEGRAKMMPSPPTRMLLILRRRNADAARRVLLANLFRWVVLFWARDKSSIIIVL